MECLRLRVKHLDFTRNEVVVRQGKGGKDRVTMLAAAIKDPLLRHLDWVRRLHERDLQAGVGQVPLPDALARKYPNTNRGWGWQWVFPAARMCTDRASARRSAPTCTSRCPNARFTRRPARRGSPQELLGHRDVKTPMIYTHVLNRGGHGVQSPADRLLAAPAGGVNPQGSRVNTPRAEVNIRDLTV